MHVKLLYGNYLRYLTQIKLNLYFSAYCYLSAFFLIIFECFPMILDVILPLNESRPFQLVVLTEYFVNQERYIHYLILHELLTGLVAINVFCGTGVILVMYIMHACALFKIAR